MKKSAGVVQEGFRGLKKSGWVFKKRARGLKGRGSGSYINNMLFRKSSTNSQGLKKCVS